MQSKEEEEEKEVVTIDTDMSDSEDSGGTSLVFSEIG